MSSIPDAAPVPPGYISWWTASFVNEAIGASLKQEQFMFSDWGMNAAQAGQVFEREWLAEREKARVAGITNPATAPTRSKAQPPSLARALWRAFRAQFLLAAALKLAWGGLVLAGVAYFVRSLLGYIRFRVTDPEHTFDEEMVGVALCIGFFVCMILLSLALQQMSIVSARLGLRVESAVAAVVYKKSLTYDRAAHSVDVTSLVANDCSKLNSASTMLQYLWSGAVEAIAILLILVGFVGRAALPGLGVVLLLIPIQFLLGAATAKARKATVIAADNRVRLTDEVLRSIKLVKMYTWETMFATSVSAERIKEELIQSSAANLKSINFAIVFCAPPLIALSIFGVHALESPLEATLAFTTLSLFNTLRLPLVLLPKGLNAMVEAISSAERITAFLLLPDRAENKNMHDSTGIDGSFHVSDHGFDKNANVAIVVQDAASTTEIGTIEFVAANFSFGAHVAILRNVNLRCAPGSLTIVTGTVGSGKSNLLLAALGQMTCCVGGEIRSAGAFAFVPQTPWCAHGTVRDNILFGKPWDERRYRAILFACALERDMELLENSDLTAIGERGMNLSGGQRQRIAVARAVYAKADIVLLDSPLSAVDAYTCQHIFQHAIMGILKDEGATIVLVTHQVELFSLGNQLVVMRDGDMAFVGAPTAKVVREYFPDSILEHAADEADSITSSPMLKGKTRRMSGDTIDDIANSQADVLVRALSLRAVIVKGEHGGPCTPRRPSRLIAAANLLLPLASPTTAALASSKKPLSLSTNSEGGTGTATNSYVALARELRWPLVFMVVSLFLVTQLTRIFSDIWIASWVSKVYANRPEEWYIAVYGGYVAGFFTLLYLRGIVFYSVFKNAFSRMHDAMFIALLRAPMSYFVQTPLGCITSVVSKDMDEISDALTGNDYLGLVYIMILFTTIGIIIAQVRIFLAVLAVLLVFFIIICVKYLKASHVLKAQAGEATSSIFAHVAESTQGASVIQAFRAEARYTLLYEKKLYVSQNARFTMETLQLWLSVRQDLIGCLMVFLTCILCVSFEKTLPPAAAGLAISSSFQILLFLSLMVRTLASAHDAMSSVDRVRALGAIAREADNSSQQPPLNWPLRGEIEFNNVTMSYLPAAPHVLKGVNFHVLAGEKVGIVGRSGAGKSSLIQALFRLAPASEGVIRVDGVDVSQLVLNALRKSIAILPQEPVMFEGTLRSNLDPFGQLTDVELTDALDKCLLRDVLDNHAKGLLQPVSSSGSNFSLGQQQLVCLARALLNNSTVLLLDEATASLDAETDKKVQGILRSAFASRTILTIAHRIDTVIDSDRILVMDAGRVAEFASPAELLSNDSSIFSQLCRQSGTTSFAALRESANQHATALLELQSQVREAVAAGTRVRSSTNGFMTLNVSGL